MAEMTFYEQLGLPRDASMEEIRRAYRQLVLRLHPDTNVNKGETELFIDIQHAYERLSDPKKKVDYDQQLPVEPDIISPIHLNTMYSQASLVRLNEPQVLYSLLDVSITPQTADVSPSIPLNISLIVDCSTSMQGFRLDTVKLTAIDILRQLKVEDTFSLVKFNDWAELLIPPGSLVELKSAEMKVQLLQAGGGTEIYKGLKLGFDQVQKFRSNQRVNHLILITDGRTYGDEADCDELSNEASALGIGISVLGIGSQWNDKFLDQISSKTGGVCKFIPDGGDIRNTILQEISRLASNITEQINFNYHVAREVELASAYRVQPYPSPLEIATPINLGTIPRNNTLSVIFEFVIKDIPVNLNMFSIASGFINIEIPRHSLKKKYIERMTLSRPITVEPLRENPPVAIINALSLMSLIQMQERAREEMSKGEIDSAARHMENLATHLIHKGEKKLAQSVMNEVAYIRHNQSFSEDGEKRIKYGTRSLLLPARTDKD